MILVRYSNLAASSKNTFANRGAWYELMKERTISIPNGQYMVEKDGELSD